MKTQKLISKDCDSNEAAPSGADERFPEQIAFYLVKGRYMQIAHIADLIIKLAQKAKAGCIRSAATLQTAARKIRNAGVVVLQYFSGFRKPG